jgi:hypothetical protein
MSGPFNYIPTSGQLLLNSPTGSPAFTTYMENLFAFDWSVGAIVGQRDMVWYSSPSNSTTLGGTERMRLTKTNGSLLIGTSTDDTTAILKVESPSGTYMRGSETAPKMTTTQRLVKSSGFWKLSGATISYGSGYVPGTYTGVPLTGGTGSGAVCTIIIGSGGGFLNLTVTSSGTGYVSGDVLSASNTNLGGSGSGYSVTVTYLNFFVRENEEVYDTTLHKRYVWDGTTWQPLW